MDTRLIVDSSSVVSLVPKVVITVVTCIRSIFHLMVLMW